MIRLLFVALALTLPSSAVARSSERTQTPMASSGGDDTAWTILEGLTTEVGPRLAGTEAEARARSWSVARLKALGFSNVRVEPFEIPVWVRGEEKAWVTSPFPQPLAVTALGDSGGS